MIKKLFYRIRLYFNRIILHNARWAVCEWADNVPKKGSGLKAVIDHQILGVIDTAQGWHDFLFAAKSIILASGDKSNYSERAIKKIERAGKVFGKRIYNKLLLEGREFGDEKVKQWYYVRSKNRS